MSEIETEVPPTPEASTEAASGEAAAHAPEACAGGEAAAHAEIKRLKADVIITRHVAVAAGAGLIPMPIVDFAAVTGVQLNMLAQICGVYEQPFSKEAARSIIAALLGGAISGQASALVVGSRMKMIPVAGTVASWLVTPAASAAATYAVGKVFVRHLESGGTLFTFEAKKMKEYMKKAAAEGRKLAPRWGTPAQAAAPAPDPEPAPAV